MNLTHAPIHFHSSDDRFCGSRIQGRRFTPLAHEVTCPICRAKDAQKMTQEKIVTEFVYPPIPDRSMDWSAVRDGYCGCGECKCLIGRGPTEEAAVADLIEKEAERG